MSELDNNEALNAIANSLEEIAYAMKAPGSASGGLSTFQEMCAQLNEIQGYMNKIDDKLYLIADSINESALNANNQFVVKEFMEWFYDLKSATCSIARSVSKKKP